MHYSYTKNRFVLAIIVSVFAVAFASGHLFAAPIPSVVHGMDPHKSIWRDNYRNRFFVEVHKYSSIAVLKGYKSDNPAIKEAVEAKILGKNDRAIEIIKDQLANIESPAYDEILYVAGLIYESLSFKPEAMGYYSRVLSRLEGNFYGRTVLRMSLLRFITGLKTDSVFKMIDADGGFYRIYKQSDEPEEWSEALAGHALMLYVFAQHSHSEYIFDELDKDDELNIAYQLARAENYMSLGLLLNARIIYHKLLDGLVEGEEDALRSYIYLRLGDIFVMREEYDEAESYYFKIPDHAQEDEEAEEGNYADYTLMKHLAYAELNIKQNNNITAIDRLRRLYDGTLPGGLGLDKTVALYLIDLYAKEGMEEESFKVAKEFLLRNPGSMWEDEVWGGVDAYIDRVMGELHNKEDFRAVADFYYENSNFMRTRSAYMISGDAFLRLKLPSEAKRIYSALYGREGRKEARIIAGLAKAHSLLGEGEDARMLVEVVRPRTKEEVKKYSESLKALGDLYVRSGDFKGALWAYSNARRGLADLVLELSYARVLLLEGRLTEAQTVLESILSKEPTDEVRGNALMSYGEVNFYLNRFTYALGAYSEAARVLKGIERAEALFRTGEVHNVMRNSNSALEAWKKARELDAEGRYGLLAADRIKEVSVWQRSRM